MSEFIAKIKAELDSKEMEQKLDSLTKESRKVKVEVDTSKMDETVKNTEKIKNKEIKVKTKIDGSKDIKNVSGDLNTATKSANGLGNAFSKLGAYFNVFKQIEQGAKQAVKVIEDIDKSIVDLQMATGDSYSNIKELIGGYNDFAKQLGATTTEVSAGASDWLRQGKSIAETNRLIQDSMVLSKVANINSEDSTSYLTAMMKGYKKAADEVSEINDALTSIDLAAAVDAGGLAEATSRVAASADLAGVSLNKLLGYEAAVGEASQESMSVIGNSFKTIFSRMSDIKAGKLELIDEDGTTEVLSDVETVLNNVGIQLRSSTNEFRGFDDVLDDTAKKWESLSSVQQAAVSKAFAGQRQANRFKLLMENYNTALQYEKIANESSGTAIQKFNDGYLNSIEAKQKSLQASFESLSVNLVSRDSINGILEATQALVEFIDKYNLLKGALAGLATGGMLKGFVALTAAITQAAMKMQNFHEAMNLLKAGNIGDKGIKQMSVLVDGLSSSQLNAIISSKHLAEQLKMMTDTQRMSILNTLGMSEAQATATLSTMGLATAENTATASTISLGSAFKGLLGTLAANPIVWISTALMAGVMAWNHHNQKVQESIQKATDAATAYKETSSAIQEQINKYKELKSQLDSGVLTPSEEYETRQQILDIQNEITSQYGSQVSNIDLVNGSLQTQLGILQQITSENAKTELNKNRKEYKDASKQMSKERDYYLGSVKVSDQSDLRKDIDGIVDSFEDAGISLTKSGGGGTLLNILFKGDATQAEESIDSFMSKIEELKFKYDDEDSIDIIDSILNQASESLQENQKVLDDYQDNYKTFLQMDMMSQGTGEGTVADAFNKYTEAVEQYNEALSGGDTDNINKMRSDFAFISSEVDEILSKGDNDKFTTLFDDATEQLSAAGVKMFDFQEALSGVAGNNNQFSGLSEGIKSASNELKNLKLDAVDVLDALVTEGKQAGEDEIWSLAESWGLSAESSKEDIQTFIDVLVQAGIVSGEVASSIEIASKSFDTYSSSVQKAQENLDILQSAISESVSGAGLSADNLKSFREMFGDDAEKALEKTANGYHLNKKALSELQVKMDQMSKTEYLSALSDQYTELQNIEGQIAAAEVLGQDTTGLEASRNGILDNISSLQDLQIQYEAATSAYQQWQSAMSGGEEGDMYDSIYGNIEKAKELYDQGLTGTNAFREFTDLMSNKDLSTASNEEIVAAYESAMPKIKEFFTEGQEGAQNFLEEVNSINAEWVHMNEDGSWKIDFGMNQDQDIADALGIDVEAVQAIMRKLSDYGFDINLDRPISSMEELKSQAESANSSLSKMGDDLQIDFKADSLEDIDSQISSLKEYINDIDKSDIDLDVKTDKIDSANSILEYLVARKQEIGKSENVDVSIDVDESELQAGYDTLNQLKSNLSNMHGKVGVDTSGIQADIDSCISRIESMSPEMKVALGIQGMSVEQIKAGLTNGTIKVPVSADTQKANSNIDGVEKKKIADKKFNVIANTSQATAAISGVKSYLSTLTSKTVTVTVNKVTNETTNKSSNSSKGGTHDVQGTAHVQGTAYANGNWGNPVAGKKLVGELGTEIIVDPHTGHWYTVGDNGAEFVEVPKNAIVFNHLQSENLLKNGHVFGRGQALASGTALSDGTGTFNVRNSGSKSTKKKNTTKGSNSKTKKKGKGKGTTKKDTKKFKETFDWIEVAIDRIERAIESVDLKASSAYRSWSNRNKNLKTEISKVNTEITKQNEGYKRYNKQAEKVSESAIKNAKDGGYTKKEWNTLKEKAKNGKIDISTIKNEKLATRIKEYQQWYEKALDCKDAVEELNEKVSELYETAFNNVVSQYESILSIIEHKKNMLDEAVSQSEEKGYITSVKYYDALIKNENANIDKLKKERTELIKTLNEGVKKGNIKKESEAWYEMVGQINDVTLSIEEANTAIIGFGNSIRDIQWEIFDLLQKKITHITDESKFLTDLLSNDKLYTDKGQLTDEGLATMGLHGVNYNVDMAQADKYAKEIANLDKQIAKNPYDQNLLERRQELLELQQDMILAAEDEKQAIRDMVEEGINKELDSLKDLIDTYTEAMDAQKDLYDYQKRVKDQTKEIANLQKMLDAYKGDTSEEAKSKVQEYKVSLEEAKDDLEETEYDRYVSDQKKMLDTLYDEYEEILNKRLDNIEALVSDMIVKINENAGNINSTLSEKAESVGYDLSSSMESIWGGAKDVLTTYGEYIKTGIENAATTVNATLGIINVNIQNMISQLNALANTKVQSANTSSASDQKKSTTSNNPGSIVVKQPSQPIKQVTLDYNKSKGNGKAEVGDKVTFSSGKYYSSSAGTGVSGTKNRGKSVYITRIKKGAKKPYHISTGKKLGSGDLGWVNLSQLKGYAKGTTRVTHDQLAWTQEGHKPEVIIRKSDGAVLTPLGKGDMVLGQKQLKQEQIETLRTLLTSSPSHIAANSGAANLKTAMQNINNIKNNTVSNSEVHLTMNFPNVTNYDEFIERVPHDLMHNKNFVGAIQAATVGEMSGGSSLRKYRF